MTGLGRVQRGKPFVVAEDFADEVEFAALTARCERLAAAYLNAEAAAAFYKTDEYCRNHAGRVVASVRRTVASSTRAHYRKNLHPGDLPGDALEGGEG